MAGSGRRSTATIRASYPGTVLVTGANRGLGLELVRQYAAEGWRVIATCRNPDSAVLLREVPGVVRLYRLDLSYPEQVDQLALALDGEAVDLIYSNAAWAVKGEGLRQVTRETWDKALGINAFATLKLAQSLTDVLARSRYRTLVAVSSTMGGGRGGNDGGRYAYRASKAALNMIVKTLAVDLASRDIRVISMHPGWVRTRFGGLRAPLSVEQSVEGMRAVVAGLEAGDSGRLLMYDGREMPW